MTRLIQFKNAKIAFSEKGKGSAVILLHGFLENSSMWNDSTQRLSKNYRVICIDLPGHGKSACIGYVHSMDLMAEAVESVLKFLKIRRAILIGHSMGGYVALAYAEKYTKKVKGLCLMNSTATEDWGERKEFRSLAIKTVQKKYAQVVKISIRNLFSVENQERLKPKIKEVVKEALATPIQGYIAAQEGMKNRPNREKVLLNPSFMTLQISGEKDDVICLDVVQKENQRTQVPLKILPGGHMSHIENKEALISILYSFVKSC